MKKVLLLGSTGNVGTGFIQEYLEKYKDNYELILGVHRKKPEGIKLKTRKIYLDDLKSLIRAFKGIDVIVNLAANPSPKADFKDLVSPNLIGTYNVFEAAVKAKCKRVIFASSVHAIKGYDLDYKVRGEDSPKPLTIYGATKAFGEALCYTFSHKDDLSCIGIRIGAYTAKEDMYSVCHKRTDYHYVISQEDMAQLIHKSIVAKDKLKYAILSGISKNKKHSMDLKRAKELVGYDPKDDAYKICGKLKV